MAQVLIASVAAVIVAATGYVLGADITGETWGAVLFAIVGAAVGWAVAAMAVGAATRRGHGRRVR